MISNFFKNNKMRQKVLNTILFKIQKNKNIINKILNKLMSIKFIIKKKEEILWFKLIF